MKTKYLFFGLLMILLTSLASAGISSPYVIHGNVVSGQYPVMNAELRIDGLHNGQTHFVKTDYNGFFQFDLGNLDPDYRTGDSLKVTLSFCALMSECQKTAVVLADKASFKLENWDISKISQPAPTDITIVKFKCWDGTIVDDSAKCPVQPIPEPVVKEVEITKFFCLDGTEVSDNSQCPEQSNSWILYIIGILVLLFGAGKGGIKIYNGKFKHLHRGIVGYHDPNTSHSNPKYRHRTWKENPLGCISDVKKIEKGIDLSIKEGQ